jgi:hypothetical protein
VVLSVEQNADPGRDLVLDPGSVPGSDFGKDMDSGTGLDPGLNLDSNKEIVSIIKPTGPILASFPELLSVTSRSDAGLETQGDGDSGDTSVQGRDGGSAVPDPPPLFSDTGLEAVDVGAGEESGLPLSVVAPTSEDSMAIVAGDGFSQMPAPSFSVSFAEEFFGFLPTGSLSKDWEDFYSSLPTD